MLGEESGRCSTQTGLHGRICSCEGLNFVVADVETGACEVFEARRALSLEARVRASRRAAASLCPHAAAASPGARPRMAQPLPNPKPWVAAWARWGAPAAGKRGRA